MILLIHKFVVISESRFRVESNSSKHGNPEGDFHPQTMYIWKIFDFLIINNETRRITILSIVILFPVIFVLFSFISATDAIKCYICGPGADAPFFESRSANINRTFIEQKVHKSCDEFDRIPLEEKYKYEMECPEDFVGCMLNVGGETINQMWHAFASMIYGIMRGIEKLVLHKSIHWEF